MPWGNSRWGGGLPASRPWRSMARQPTLEKWTLPGILTPPLQMGASPQASPVPGPPALLSHGDGHSLGDKGAAADARPPFA
eukprot:6655433-Pyramimonas_sp.AAC.1